MRKKAPACEANDSQYTDLHLANINLPIRSGEGDHMMCFSPSSTIIFKDILSRVMHHSFQIVPCENVWDESNYLKFPLASDATLFGNPLGP